MAIHDRLEVDGTNLRRPIHHFDVSGCPTPSRGVLHLTHRSHRSHPPKRSLCPRKLGNENWRGGDDDHGRSGRAAWKAAGEREEIVFRNQPLLLDRLPVRLPSPSLQYHAQQLCRGVRQRRRGVCYRTMQHGLDRRIARQCLQQMTSTSERRMREMSRGKQMARHRQRPFRGFAMGAGVVK